MNPADDSESKFPSTPGKVRTWWHPLLVGLLDRALSGAYEVRDEVNVGRMPLRIDIVLIRRQDGQLPESAMRDVSALVKRLNRFTLVEFKSPTDALEAGDLDTLFGCAHLFRAQHPQPIMHTELNLILLVPGITQPFRDDLQLSGLTAHEEEPGIHRIVGHAFATWVIETDLIAGSDQPVLSLFSRVFLSERDRIMAELLDYGHEDVLWYVLQQIQQFQKAGEDFQMQHTDVTQMNRVSRELKMAVIQAIPAEERLAGLSAEERLAGLSPAEVRTSVLRAIPAEERLAGLSAEQRRAGLSTEELLEGLSADEMLEGLSKEQLDRLRELLLKAKPEP